MAEHKLVINLATKQSARVPLTPEDIAQRAADAARPPKPHFMQVEAERRISQAYPAWELRDMTARQGALMNLHITNGLFTPEEQAEWDEVQTGWAWIKAVHDASAALQAMDPIPQNYIDDSYWPR